MKKILYGMLCGVCFINASAQEVIVDISEPYLSDPRGVYFKDISNILNPFSGTYIYTNGNTMLKIVMVKKLRSTANGSYFLDLIVGELQYIGNGIEKWNTLNKLDKDYKNGWIYSIAGNTVITGKAEGCQDCAPSEKHLSIALYDSGLDETANFEVRRTADGILLEIKWIGQGKQKQYGPETPYNLPGGKYLLTKQP